MKTIQVEKTACIVCNSSSFHVLTTGRDYEYNSCTNLFTIAQCTDCGHVYLNPKPTLREFPTIYPNNYYSYHFPAERFSLAAFGKRFIERKTAALYKNLIGSKGRILDVGCGDGRLLNLLKQTKNQRWELYGLDFNAQGNKLAEEEGIHIFLGTFEEATLPKHSFDLIILNEVFEHLYDPRQSLRKIHSLLKPDGYIVIETPCLGSWDFRLFKRSYWGGYHIPRHLNIFSKNSIRSILQQTHFSIVREESLLSPPFWILSIHNRLQDRGWNRRIVRFFHFYNPILLALFTIVDLIQMRLGPTSTMRIIARKKHD